ncbi:helix-turn-helix transcriptional regulator [Mycoplasmatota bacterium WC30]
MNIGEILKEYRTLYGYTQQDVADYLKISQVTYNRYENNVREPNIDTLVGICNLYYISINGIFALYKGFDINKVDLSVASGMYDYELKHVLVYQVRLLMSGLIESEDNYVFVENKETKEVRQKITEAINNMSFYKKFIDERISDHDNLVKGLKEQVEEVKTGSLYTEEYWVKYMEQMFKIKKSY